MHLERFRRGWGQVKMRNMLKQLRAKLTQSQTLKVDVQTSGAGVPTKVNWENKVNPDF